MTDFVARLRPAGTRRFAFLTNSTPSGSARLAGPTLRSLAGGALCALALAATTGSAPSGPAIVRAARPPFSAARSDSARQLQILTAPAESLHVMVDGEGSPIVLIPGLFGSAFGFRKVVPLLTSAGYRVVIVEPLGIGTSGRPARADYSLTAQADRVAAALDTLDVGAAIMVGHSIGGSIALRLAYRRPERARGIISIEGGPTERAATPTFGRVMRFAPLIKLFGGINLIRHQLRRRLIAASGDTTWIVAPVIDGYTAGAASNLGATLRAFRAMADSREPELLGPHLAQITCPVRLLVGGARHESGATGDDIELMRRSLRSFDVDSEPGAGHFIFEEQPQAIIAAVLRIDGNGSRRTQ